jgi:hypothetical protein
MAYNRQYRSNSWNNKQVQVTLAWNSLVGAYDLKFDSVYGDQNWTKLKAIIAWIKMTIPYGERDYDEVSKIWTIHEKYFAQMRDVLNNIGSEFNVTCVEKPVGSPAVTFTPIEVYFDIFKQASGEDIRSFNEADFNKAKKIYFRTAMRLHPDRGGDAKQMTDFNHAWDVLKERHFKIQRVMAQMES